MSHVATDVVDSSFRVELPDFEGPLDLLLHLIQKHELNVLDLPIAFVTKKYLEYLDVMKQLDLDVASEYLVMAATLALIKSRMLVPSSPIEDESEEDQVDPRAELILRLLQYQKYKSAAEQLAKRDLAGRDVFPRGQNGVEYTNTDVLAEVSIFSLLDAFQKVFDRAQNKVSFQIDAERISLQDRITQLTELLQAKPRCVFEDLFEDAYDAFDTIVTFLALLEMAKMKLVRLYQIDSTTPIHLEYRVLRENAVESNEVPERGADIAMTNQDVIEA